MNRSLRLGIELPPVPATLRSAGPSGPEAREAREGEATVPDPWWHCAQEAIAAGAGTVWFTGGPHRDAAPTDVSWCDPCTMAAGSVATLPGATLGVISPLPAGRHPSVLAREITTLDVLSGGRSAVLVHWDVPAPADPVVACEFLADAVAVCAAILRGNDPAFEGRHLQISGAVNRPSPAQAGGPPVAVAVPAGAEHVPTGRGPAGRAGSTLARQLAALADAVVCPPDPAVLAAWRAVVDGVDPDRGVDGVDPDRGKEDRRVPGLLCTTAIGELGEVSRSAALVAARDAGADGIIVRLGPSLGRWAGVEGSPSRFDAGAVRAAVAEAFAPWAGRAS